MPTAPAQTGASPFRSMRQIFDLLDRRGRRLFFLLVAMSLAMGLAEMASVISVVPFLAVVAEPSAVETSRWLGALDRALGLEDTDAFLAALGALAFVALCVTMSIRVLTFFLLTRFVRLQSASLGARLVERYLGEPYDRIALRHATELSANVHAEAQQVIDGAVVSAMRLLAHSAVAASLLGLLLAMDPVAGLAMGAVLGLGYGLAFALIRGRVLRLGLERTRLKKSAWRVLHDALSGIREVKLHHREDDFVERFRTASRRLAGVQAELTLLRDLPKCALELLVFGSMILFVIASLATREGGMREALPVLGVYALAAARLFPVLQKIYAALATLRGEAPALDHLHAELAAPPRAVPAATGMAATGPDARGSTTTGPGATGPGAWGQVATGQAARESAAPGAPRTEPPAIGAGGAGQGAAGREAAGGAASERSGPLRLRRELELTEVVYRYPGAARPALDGLSLRVPAGSVVGICGPTGAGKTTAVDLILGLLTPERGRLRVDGTTIDAGNVRDWQRSVGYVPQDIHLTADSIAANIVYGAADAATDAAALLRAAEGAGLTGFVGRLPQGLDTPVGDRGVRLSGGQRQRIGIARALYRDADLLVFDEATSALDGLTETEVMDAVQAMSRGRTIVLVAHRLKTLRRCDLVYLIEEGRVSDVGTYDELRTRNGRFRLEHETAA